MSHDRRIIFQLLAAGRINAPQAERLLAVTGADRESLWALLGCAALAALAQTHWLAPELRHLFKSLLAAGLPALQHAITTLLFSLGGMS